MSKRLELELLTVDGLREIAKRRGVDPRTTKPILLKKLAALFDRVGWPASVVASGAGASAKASASALTQSRKTMERSESRVESAGAAGPSNTLSSETDVVTAGQRGTLSSADIQHIVDAVIRTLSEQQGSRQRSEVMSLERDAFSGNVEARQAPINSWNQIKFTSRLIPIFSGKEHENVITWLNRASSVATACSSG